MNQTFLADLARLVVSGRQSARQVVDRALNRAQQAKDYNIFTTLLGDQARRQADEIDQRLKAGQPVGQLAGVPFVVKDNFLVRQTLTTAAAPLLADFVAPYSATTVTKLINQDAVLIAKTNLDAFGHGASTESSLFGPTKNPHQPTRVAGGSSGGSAAALAAGVCSLALGTDTGGSIRLPASFCGLVGYKPTYGLLSRYGVVAMSSSTDCVSLLTTNSQDAQLVAGLLAGQDQFDGTSLPTKINWHQPNLPARPKVGFISQFLTNLAPEVKTAFSDLRQLLSANDQLEVVDVSLPSLDLSLACYYILIPAEISSNLSRYSGLFYGHQQAKKSVSATIGASRQAGFLAENKRRIMLGTYVLSAGYYEAYYHQALKLRQRISDEFSQALAKVDFLLSPVAPMTAFDLGSKKDPLQMYLADLMTVGVSLAGLPAVSLPLPVAKDQPPIGLQIIAGARQDANLLAMATELDNQLNQET